MIHPNIAAASLGFATSLQDKMLAQQSPQTPPNAPQTPTEPQGEAKPQETAKEPPKEDLGAKMTEMELSFTKQLDQIRKEMKDDQAKELEGLKTMITSALAEEDTNEPNKTA